MRPSLLNPLMQDMRPSSRDCSPLLKTHAWDPRVAVIRKELVALTGDSDIAVVLNQLLYWSQRLKDYDLLLEEEKSIPYQGNIHEGEGQGEEEFSCLAFAQHGWFYKSTSDLIEETLLCVSRVTMRRYLNVLVERGWIQERGNPKYKWDRTTHYRVNLYQLDKDLKAIGYRLPDFILEEDITEENPQKSSMSKIEPSRVQKLTLECKESEQSNVRRHPSLSLTEENPQKCSLSKIEPSRVQKLTLECKESEQSNVKKCTFIPENKTETINREHTQNARAHEDKNFSEKNFSAEVLEIWNACLSQEEISPVHLTTERRRRIYSLLSLYFDNDLAQWKQFCKRIAHSSFLMGQGARRWRISLDWILIEENLLKVLEGNFDDPDSLEPKQVDLPQVTKAQEICSVLESIADPTWQKWCSQLDFSFESHNYVSLEELKAIAKAQFLEVEDDRLAWVGSKDTIVLSRIDDLRFKLLPIVQRTFPTVRSVRTRLIGKETSPQHETILSCSLKSNSPQQKGENDAE